MRIDTTQIPAHEQRETGTGSNLFKNSPAKGDSIEVQVLYATKDSVVMKNNTGQSFKAKLDNEVELTPGEHILLEVIGVEEGIITLAVRDKVQEEGITRSDADYGFEDKSLVQFGIKLEELNIPVTENTAKQMSALLEKYPEMTLDEAAFIASNKLSEDDALVKAALSALAENSKTGAMIEDLRALILSESSLVSETQESWSESQVTANQGYPEENSDDLLVCEEASTFTGNIEAQNRNQLESVTQWLALINNGATEEAAAYLCGDAAWKPVDDEIARYDATDAKGATVDDNSEVRGDSIIAEKNHFDDQMINNGSTIGNERNAEANNTAKAATFAFASDKNDDILGSDGSLRSTESSLNPSFPAWDAKGSIVDQPKSFVPLENASRAISQLLSELPEFNDTPTPLLEKFSTMLLRVSGDIEHADKGDVGMLLSQLEKLFARIEKNDRSAGMRIKSLKEEFFARLALVDEAISQSNQSGKGEMLEQTRKFMDHVRLLNSIEQFAYMQIPYQIDDARKTAELYVFKKKGSKRIDPENVSILVALDLEHMGHWEGLINFRNKDVSLKMEVEGINEKEHFSANTVMLYELLAEIGFRLLGADISIAKNETTPITALSTFNRMTKGSIGINLTV